LLSKQVDADGANHEINDEVPAGQRVHEALDELIHRAQKRRADRGSTAPQKRPRVLPRRRRTPIARKPTPYRTAITRGRLKGKMNGSLKCVEVDVSIRTPAALRSLAISLPVMRSNRS
jgi:hypothetical protein